MTHLTREEKDNLHAEIFEAVKAAVLALMERERAKGVCAECFGRSCASALARHTGIVGASVAVTSGADVFSEQFTIGLLMNASYAQEVGRLKAAEDIDLADMPIPGRPS